MDREVTRKEVLAMILCKCSYDRNKIYRGDPWGSYITKQWSKYTGSGSPDSTAYIREHRVPALEEYTRQGGLMTVMVGRLQTENTLCIAFQGSYNLHDAAADVNQAPSSWADIEPLLQNGVHRHLKFHRGFLDRVRGTRKFPAFPRQFLVDFVRNNGSLVITGHSMGGAVASILTLAIMADLCKLGESPAVVAQTMQCITFGTPSFCHQTYLHTELKDSRLLNVFMHFQHRSDAVANVYAATDAVFQNTWVRDLARFAGFEDYVIPGHRTPGGYICLSDSMITDPSYECPPFFTSGNGGDIAEKSRRFLRKSVVYNAIAPHFLYTYGPLIFRYVYTKEVKRDPRLANCTSLYDFLTR